MEHMHAAIHHLQQAGVTDLVRAARHRSEELEHEFARDHEGHSDQRMMLRELAHQVQELREQVEKLSRKFED